MHTILKNIYLLTNGICSEASRLKNGDIKKGLPKPKVLKRWW